VKRKVKAKKQILDRKGKKINKTIVKKGKKTERETADLLQILMHSMYKVYHMKLFLLR
jgi:hypothetical protein